MLFMHDLENPLVISRDVFYCELRGYTSVSVAHVFFRNPHYFRCELISHRLGGFYPVFVSVPAQVQCTACRIKRPALFSFDLFVQHSFHLALFFLDSTSFCWSTEFTLFKKS